MNTRSAKTVCVVGAGIVGCATAYQLTRLGHQVVLVDAQPGPGQLTSLANGAQLSYSYVEPLASPTTLRSLPSLLLAADSPLRFRLRADWRQWAWGLQFLRACTATQVRSGTAALLQLAALSRSSLQQWMTEDGLQFAHRANGKLVLCPTPQSLAKQARQVQLQRELGCEQQVLDRDACIRREPALAAYAPQFAGGVWTASESLGDCHQLCLELLRAATARGLQTRFGTQVLGFETLQGRIAAARTAQGPIQADVFVLATGAQAATLAGSVGIYLPVYPIKGYSTTLKLLRPEKAPQVSVTDLARKTVFAPLGNSLRVAAMAEVVGYDTAIPPARVDAMLQAVEQLFPGACDLHSPQPWAGLRPATPSSVPIVGASRIPNLLLNVGHGALGFTLAAGSAVRLGAHLAAR